VWGPPVHFRCVLTLTMAKNKYFKIHVLTLAQQVYFMRIAYPAFSCASVRKSATWMGTLQPTALSCSYRLQMRYRPTVAPEIKVLSPELKKYPAHEKLPHFYHSSGLLCLHDSDDWKPALPIAQTIMQWISGWLYFYEVWLFTGSWVGGGTHPDAPQHRAL
jgi:hypothetical protein